MSCFGLEGCRAKPGSRQHYEGLEDTDMAEKLALAPGETGELTVTFEDANDWVVCLIPGHYAAGMRMEVLYQR